MIDKKLSLWRKKLESTNLFVAFYEFWPFQDSYLCCGAWIPFDYSQGKLLIQPLALTSFVLRGLDSNQEYLAPKASVLPLDDPASRFARCYARCKQCNLYNCIYNYLLLQHRLPFNTIFINP